MMNEKTMFSIVSKIFNKKEIENLAQKLVIQNKDNSYTLFDEYNIERIDNRYRVTSIYTYLDQTFNNLRIAVIWTTLYKRNLISDANRIIELDRTLEGANFNIELHEKLFKKSKNLDNKSLFFNKLTHDKLKKKEIEHEIENYLLGTKANY